ncbi:hypothetical protein BS47DRAFT_1350759 [Hydnum rufescens UP504]|uniref:MT-A70-domain-containing protein n=1 Tax=Hydnum rufescens UP504 TaxID=1448309 RepID=A0A9P6DR38_9AGAM|nr:hypothetical protein BS47DRAFT_1350759 [Hydnum rufescens UP504]
MPVPESLALVNELLNTHAALRERVIRSQEKHRRILSKLPSPPSTSIPPILPSTPPRDLSPERESSEAIDVDSPSIRADLPPAKRLRALRYKNYVPEEETIRNDYSQRYVDGGEWPQNWVLGAEPERRFEEYPKQQRLLNLKKVAVAENAHSPCFLPLSDLSSLLPCKFDVILIDPPFSSTFTWDNLLEYPVPALAAEPSFVFLWVGSGAGDGLERGREMLAKWGYRRCEDVVWIRSNRESNLGPGTDAPTTSLFMRTKQHLLVGIRGTVRRSTDNWFVHCNIDTDVMIWEGDPSDPTRKPPETYTLIESFCLGLRRLEIFGRTHSLRRGWVTVGDDIDVEIPPLSEEDHDLDSPLEPPKNVRQQARRWDREWWENEVRRDGKSVVPSSAEIENLRPKSPNRNGSTNRQTNNNFNNGGNGSGQFNMNFPLQLQHPLPQNPQHSFLPTQRNQHGQHSQHRQQQQQQQPQLFNAFSLQPHMMNMMQPQMNMNMMDMNAMSMMGMNGMNPAFAAAQMNPMLAAQMMGNMGGVGTVGSMGNSVGMPTHMGMHQQPMQPIQPMQSMQMQIPMPMQIPMTSAMPFNRFGASTGPIAGIGGDPSGNGMAVTPMQQSGNFGMDRNGATWMTGLNQAGATNSVGVFPPTTSSGNSSMGAIQYWNPQPGIGNQG